MPRLALRNIHLAYGAEPAILEDVSLTIGTDDVVAVLGPSGSGKTSLLKLAAGFVKPTSGGVTVDGNPVTGPGADRAVVFQDDALFPWLDTVGNVALALTLRGVPIAARLSQAAAVLDRLGLSGFGSRKIWELSGGQRQRVGLARALVAAPRFLLMDEPFGALDALTRAQMHTVVLDVWKRLQPGILFITHDVDEALLLGTHLVVLATHPGRIVSQTPIDFGRRLVNGERLRTIRSDPGFVNLREQVLDLVFERQAVA